MNGIYRFTALKLPNNKKGIIKPDGQGYFSTVVGGLNIYNSMNQFYALEGAKDLFESSSSLMRRMQRGALKGEVGHPRQEPGMKQEQYINRLYEIRETNVCCHFKDVALDMNYGNNNGRPGVVGVIAKVGPAGPHGEALEKAFLNPSENVCFSVRGITDDFYDRGKYVRVLKQIVCWDWVTEPGIDIAEKFKSPSLENQLVLESLVEQTIDQRTIENLIKNKSKMFSLEDSNEGLEETLRIISSKSSQGQNKISTW